METHEIDSLAELLSQTEVDWDVARRAALKTHQSDLIIWVIEAIDSGDADAVVYAELALKHQVRLGHLHEPGSLRILIGIYRDRYGYRS